MGPLLIRGSRIAETDKVISGEITRGYIEITLRLYIASRVSHGFMGAS
jgi:hypothetical protein